MMTAPRRTTVLFDLFGTLVAPFRRAEHIAAIAACSGALGIAEEECHRLWVASFPRRIRGDFRSVAGNFEWICGECDAVAAPKEILRAERIYDDFTLDGSDEELSGARSAGMTPVLLVNDLSNTYDSARKDVDQWTGRRIQSLAEIKALIH